MISISSQCKKDCNSDSLKYKEYIIIDNKTIEIKGNLSATAFNEKNFIGTFNLKTLIFETENDVDYKEKELVYYKQVNNESFKIGTFIVTEVEDSDTYETVKVTAMDYGLKFSTPYETQLDYESKKVTMQNVLDELLGRVGIELAEDSQQLLNGNFIVDSNQFVNSEVDGDVVSAIASINGMFAIINEKDQLKLMTKNPIGRPETTVTTNLLPANPDYNSFYNWKKTYHEEQAQETDYFMLISDDMKYDISKGLDVNANIQRQTGQFFTLTTLGDIWDNEWDNDFETQEEIDQAKQMQVYIYKKEDFYFVSGSADYNDTGMPEGYGIILYDENHNMCGFLATEDQFENLGGSTPLQLDHYYLLYVNETSGIKNMNFYSFHDFYVKALENQGIDYDEYYENASDEEKALMDSSLDNAKYMNYVTSCKFLNSDATPLQFTANLQKYDKWIIENNIGDQWDLMMKIGTTPYYLLANLEQYYILPAQEDEIIEDYVELDDKRDTRPITIVQLGMSQVQGVEVEARWDEGIELYGEHYLIINDNPFAYTMKKRQQLVNNILEQVKGLGYSSFESKYSFKPYLQLGDVIKFKNKAGELVESIVLKMDADYDNVTLSAPSIADATVDYKVEDLERIARRAEIIANQATGDIEIISNQVTDIGNTVESNYQDLIENFSNYYTIEQTNQMIINAQSGITNTFSESGGNNIFRNTGLWFEEQRDIKTYLFPNSETFPSSTTYAGALAVYEYWTGYAKRIHEDKAVNSNAMLIQKGSFIQEQEVPNGEYSISFYYQKLNNFANTSVIINGIEYQLDSMEEKLFYTGEKDRETGEYIVQPINVTSKRIRIEFKSSVDGALKIYDLMCNKGSVKLAYSQNYNETTTDTVNISKGITITSTNMETIFKANADGIRILTLNEEVVAYFTEKGLSTKELIVQDEAQICGTIIQEVGDQTWFTRM